jgi:hypothetical protein
LTVPKGLNNLGEAFSRLVVLRLIGGGMTHHDCRSHVG